MPNAWADKKHCPQNHEYTPENTYVHRGKRTCKACRSERIKEQRSRGLKTGDPRHGTLTGYVNFACRCVACKEAYGDTSRTRNAWRKYGLSPDDFRALESRFQELGCDLCGSKTSMQIDHCHITGSVRGVLCPGCNSGLAKFKDDPTRIRKAVQYLLNGKLEEEDFRGDR